MQSNIAEVPSGRESVPGLTDMMAGPVSGHEETRRERNGIQTMTHPNLIPNQSTSVTSSEISPLSKTLMRTVLYSKPLPYLTSQ